MDEKLIKDAQYRKGASIAFFNSVNSAIALVAVELGKNNTPVSDEYILTRVAFYRDFFLEEHKKYYSSVIANIGANYNIKDTIIKLNNCKNLDQLKTVWLSLSEDERIDVEILKVKELLKKQYESIQ